MSADAADLAQLWMETTCKASFPAGRPPRLRFTGQPEVVTTPRRSWRDNLEARVRYALKYMHPDTTIWIDDIEVESYTTSSYNRVRYRVAGVTCRDLEAAIAKVCALAEGGG